MMLEVSHLAVDHGKLRALWDVSFSVGEGQRVGLVGANGAGKSTTLGAIAGLYPIAGGAIVYDGAPLDSRSPPDALSRGIVLVPEGRRLFGEMTVRENLRMGAYGARARAALNEGYDRVFTLFPVLRDKQAQPARELSGGQQQMVAIGRALMARPRLLLLDEPFIGVAPILVDDIMTALAAIADGGVTMILVDQNIRRALRFVERASVIHNGRTVLAGDSAALLADENFATTFMGLD
ncbi:MAG: branched-chain amino acid ABC transporter ATP-binding protein [Proteobacteria bacterium]|nr:MAG: branched-chain amino acid ABC transporter ATP-binding protein [Pseudomonadota bacterium]